MPDDPIEVDAFKNHVRLEFCEFREERVEFA